MSTDQAPRAKLVLTATDRNGRVLNRVTIIRTSADHKTCESLVIADRLIAHDRLVAAHDDCYVFANWSTPLKGEEDTAPLSRTAAARIAVPTKRAKRRIKLERGPFPVWATEVPSAVRARRRKSTAKAERARRARARRA